MKPGKILPLAAVLAALIGLTACEVMYKAQNDAMYYGDRSIEQFQKTHDYMQTRFGGKPMPPEDPDYIHLINFDTFICDGARQLIVNFDRNDTEASVMFEGSSKLLERSHPLLPFSDGIYQLYVMEDGTLLVEKELTTLFRHCRPLVYDPLNAVPYDFTATMPPEEFHALPVQSAEPKFDQTMTK